MIMTRAKSTESTLDRYLLDKLRGNEVTQYFDNIVYQSDGTVLVSNPVGYALIDKTNNMTMYYYLKDHLGNVRVVADQSGTVEQVNHYYPFGGLMGMSTGSSVQPYKYNGKELDRSNGLDLYDYGARWYDAALGRWVSPDPHAESYQATSPFAYCKNDPVNRIDPDGKDYVVIYDGNSWRVSAEYYTNAESYESAQNAVSLWNGLSGQFFLDGKPVVFDLQTVVVSNDNPKNKHPLNSAANIHENGNTYEITHGTEKLKDTNVNGTTKGGRQILVREECSDKETGAHEIGHSLGLTHSSNGLMTAASSDRNRSLRVSAKQVKTIIRNAVKGEVNSEYDSGEAGKGHFYNNSDDKDFTFKVSNSNE